MGNSYFQFKKFRVEQGKAAMKVCTDSCLFGAWINTKGAKRILDIGAGTGLLSLMLAQKCDAVIEAVEIEKDAYEDAVENFSRSPWAERLSCYAGSIQKFSITPQQKYDLIVCNPPFFSNQLKSPSATRNVALHSESLSLKELTGCAIHLLSSTGRFVVLLPPFEFDILKAEANHHGLHTQELVRVRDKREAPVFRVMASFSFNEIECKESELCIKEQDGTYSAAFRELLRDYYLHL